MKHLSILIIFITSILISGEVVFKYNFEKPVVKDNKVFLTGCDRSIAAFSPALVLKQVRLILPDGEKAVSYKIEYGKPVELDGEYDISPVEASGRLSVNPPASIKDKRSEVYSIDEFYPAGLNSERFSTQFKNGHPVFMTVLNPVQYNPVLKTLRYFPEITVRVTTKAETKSSLMIKNSPEIESSLKKLVNNPDAINFVSDPKQAKSVYDYLIISPAAYAGSFTNLINFNLRRGLTTTVKSVDTIYSEISGADNSEKIRNYIIQEYTNNNITYVLLAGDAELIPCRGFRAEIMDYGTDYYDETNIPADMYYGCLDGTWKAGTSSYYGESGSEDLLWEVYVSRFSVDSTTELNNIIQKTIEYSEQPIAGKVAKNLLVGELLWEEDLLLGWVDSYGGDCMDELVGFCDHNSYETTGYSAGWTNTTLYDRDLANPWTKTTLVNKIKTDDYTWIDHLGHSNNTYNMRMTTSDVTTTNFNNDGSSASAFLIYSQGCYSGAFDNRDPYGTYITTDCIGEAFTCLANAAVAYIGNSRYGLGSPFNTDGSGQRFHRYFHHAGFTLGINNLEKMNAYSKEVNAALILEEDINLGPYFGQCKWIAYTVNALGDPALDVWTAEPQTMTVSVTDAVGPNGASVEMLVDTNAPAATVAVFFEGTYLYALTTDSNGYAAHSVAPVAGTLEYYITKHNYYQKFTSFEVVPPLNTPVNVITSVSSGTLTLNWDAVTGANSYRIYSSNDPYGTFAYLTTVTANTWNTTVTADTKKFYYIIADSEAIKK